MKFPDVPCKDELTEQMKKLTLSSDVSLDRLVVISGSMKDRDGFICQGQIMSVVAHSLPLRAIKFPQKITQIYLPRKEGGENGTLNVLSYFDMPELGTIVGPFILGEFFGDNYALHLLQDDYENLTITLIRDIEKTTEHSVMSDNKVKKFTIKLNTEGLIKIFDECDDFFYSLDTDNTLNIPPSQDELLSKINFSSLLNIIQLLYSNFSNLKFGFDLFVYDKDKIKKAMGSLFLRDLFDMSQPEASEVLIDNRVIEREIMIGFQESSVVVRQIYQPHKSSLGMVYGPVYLNTPEGGHYYVFHMTKQGGHEFKTVMVKSNSPEAVWSSLVREQMTGIYPYLDFAQLVVRRNEPNKAEVILGTSHEEKEKYRWNSVKWLGDKEVHLAEPNGRTVVPCLAEIIQILGNASCTPGISSLAPARPPENLLCSDLEKYSSVFYPSNVPRDWGIVPSQSIMAAVASVPGKIIRGAWRHKRTVAFGATVLGVGYGLAQANPEAVETVRALLPSLQDAFEAVFPYISRALSNINICDCDDATVNLGQRQTDLTQRGGNIRHK